MASEVKNLKLDIVVILEGENMVPVEALKRIVAGHNQGRPSGPDRYAIVVAVVPCAFPPQQGVMNPRDGLVLSDKVVYIVRGDNFIDALVAGALIDGPVLLLPPRTDSLSVGTHSYVIVLHPHAVLVLGGVGAIHPDTVEVTVNAVEAGLR